MEIFDWIIELMLKSGKANMNYGNSVKVFRELKVNGVKVSSAFGELFKCEFDGVHCWLQLIC